MPCVLLSYRGVPESKQRKSWVSAILSAPSSTVHPVLPLSSHKCTQRLHMRTQCMTHKLQGVQACLLPAECVTARAAVNASCILKSNPYPYFPQSDRRVTSTMEQQTYPQEARAHCISIDKSNFRCAVHSSDKAYKVGCGDTQDNIYLTWGHTE
jgi:hypothetical protein